MSKKQRVVDAIGKYLNEEDWGIYDPPRCKACDRSVMEGDFYCRRCGEELEPTEIISENTFNILWESFHAGLKEWKKK